MGKRIKNNTQEIPTSWREREILRDKGQFWTPDWIADAMVSYVLNGKTRHIFDPGVGTGAFFQAAKKLARAKKRKIMLLGTEIDPNVLREAVKNGLLEKDLENVRITDFLLNPPKSHFKSIVANPPYIRHHRLSGNTKEKLKKLSYRIIGKPLDGRTGYHVYFLIQGLSLLDKDGRLAFIMPADTCEGVSAPVLWDWITAHYCLEAVITFSPEASPFSQLDINPIIFLIKNSKPKDSIFWVRCKKLGSTQLKEWIDSDFSKNIYSTLNIKKSKLRKALDVGLSRESQNKKHSGFLLGDFVKVLRGIATGANDFFFLTKTKAKELKIPKEFLLPAIGRTRDINGAEEINSRTLEVLESAGKNTLLFSPDGRPIDMFPKPVKEYLKYAEKIGINKSPLISSRNPWYKMEVRTPPKFLFAYLGRRNSRFILNKAGVVPLTGFLCVYPKKNNPVFVNKLWRVLKHPETVKNLLLVGKSYGSGAIKVEPRALERLPLPIEAMKKVEL